MLEATSLPQPTDTRYVELIVRFSVVFLLYIAWKRELPQIFAHFVLFRLKSFLLVSCVFLIFFQNAGRRLCFRPCSDLEIYYFVMTAGNTFPTLRQFLLTFGSVICLARSAWIWHARHSVQFPHPNKRWNVVLSLGQARADLNSILCKMQADDNLFFLKSETILTANILKESQHVKGYKRTFFWIVLNTTRETILWCLIRKEFHFDLQADDVWMRASDPHHLAFLFLFNDTVRFPVQESSLCVCVFLYSYITHVPGDIYLRRLRSMLLCCIS